MLAGVDPQSDPRHQHTPSLLFHFTRQLQLIPLTSIFLSSLSPASACKGPTEDLTCNPLASPSSAWEAHVCHCVAESEVQRS